MPHWIIWAANVISIVIIGAVVLSIFRSRK